uniref:Uncharacterized protein n=1 Tax=Pipistrellus kuhlii TaxID=59472 RepID=A0A7J7XC73_PIPKU|nr:hypothetical protein mPipKuh1_010635 [Pipistrellus kuhlii]
MDTWVQAVAAVAAVAGVRPGSITSEKASQGEDHCLSQNSRRPLAWPGPSLRAAPFLHVHCTGQTGMPKRLGIWCPFPNLLPWPPSPVTPQKGMYESPSPAPSHHWLPHPSANRHISFQTGPTHFLSPPSWASALDGAFGIQGSGVLQQSWGGKG